MLLPVSLHVTVRGEKKNDPYQLLSSLWESSKRERSQLSASGEGSLREQAAGVPEGQWREGVWKKDPARLGFCVLPTCRCWLNTHRGQMWSSRAAMRRDRYSFKYVRVLSCFFRCVAAQLRVVATKISWELTLRAHTHKAAKQVEPVMKKRGWTVGKLIEIIPHNQ